MSIDHSTGCPISKKYTVNQGCMSLSTYLLEYGRHVARLRRRRRRAYAPTSNTASHDNHKKILHGFPFLSRDDYGAPLGGPSGRRSSAIRSNAGTMAGNQGRGRRLLKFSYMHHPTKNDVTSGLNWASQLVSQSEKMASRLLTISLYL